MDVNSRLEMKECVLTGERLLDSCTHLRMARIE